MAKAPRPAPADALPIDVKPQELAQRLADPEFRARIEQAVQQLPADKATELVALLEASIRRRRIEMWGYIAAAIVMLVGMVFALYLYGRAGGDSFVGWVFLLPLGLAGLTMMLVARWARAADAASRTQRAALRASGDDRPRPR